MQPLCDSGPPTADADVEWTVHLANRKATAFRVSEPRERRNKALGDDLPPARVIVGPRDFAPDIQNFVTLYDIVHQVAIDKGLVRRPTTFSFMRFVRPVLVRASGYRWVNATGDITCGRWRASRNEAPSVRGEDSSTSTTGSSPCDFDGQKCRDNVIES